MKGRGNELNIVSYNTAIKISGEGGRWHSDLELMWEMPNDDFEPEDISYKSATSSRVPDQGSGRRSWLYFGR